jgi:hypothetical protein
MFYCVNECFSIVSRIRKKKKKNDSKDFRSNDTKLTGGRHKVSTSTGEIKKGKRRTRNDI